MGPTLPILGPEEIEELETVDDPGDAPRTVLITGAAGGIGKKLAAAWADRYDLILVDAREDTEVPDLIVADLAQWNEEWTALFDEADTVIHLAANSRPDARWEDLIAPNLDATTNVFLAAAQAGVDRVIFASSCHVMGAYRRPELTEPITPALSAQPLNPYGTTKLMGERIGRAFATATGLSVIAIRVGWNQPGENRYETLPLEADRSCWLSNDDLIQVFTRAVEAELGEGEFVLAQARSNNPGSRWSIAETIARLGFEPKDSPPVGLL